MLFCQNCLVFLCLLLTVVGASAVESKKELIPPVVDIAPLVHPKNFSHDIVQARFLEMIGAAKQWGFFYAANHGIDDALLAQLEEQMTLFFALPLETKLALKRQENNSRGYANDELTKQRRDLKEVYDFGPELTPEQLALYSERARQDAVIDGFNQWIDAQILPNFRRTMISYQQTAHQLAMQLLQVLNHHFPCLQSEGSDFFLHHFDLHSSLFRLNHYPPMPAAEGLGISRHTDAGVLTVLWQQPNRSALEVYSGSKEDHGDGEWVQIKPIPGTLTINAGDMLQVWTNGLIKAAEHRVTASLSEARLSVAYFLNPNYDSYIAPVAGCVAETETETDDKDRETKTETQRETERKERTEKRERFVPIRWGDFRMQRYQGDFKDVGEEVQIEHYLRSADAEEETEERRSEL